MCKSKFVIQFEEPTSSNIDHTRVKEVSRPNKMSDKYDIIAKICKMSMWQTYPENPKGIEGGQSPK